MNGVGRVFGVAAQQSNIVCMFICTLHIVRASSSSALPCTSARIECALCRYYHHHSQQQQPHRDMPQSSKAVSQSDSVHSGSGAKQCHSQPSKITTTVTLLCKFSSARSVCYVEQELLHYVTVGGPPELQSYRGLSHWVTKSNHRVLNFKMKYYSFYNCTNFYDSTYLSMLENVIFCKLSLGEKDPVFACFHLDTRIALDAQGDLLSHHISQHDSIEYHDKDFKRQSIHY